MTTTPVTVSELTSALPLPECYVFHTSSYETHYTAAKVLNETKSQITVEYAVGDPKEGKTQFKTFAKAKVYKEQKWVDPRTQIGGRYLDSIVEVGSANDYHPCHLTFDVAQVQKELRNRRINKQIKSYRESVSASASLVKALKEAGLDVGNPIFDSAEGILVNLNIIIDNLQASKES